MSDNLPPNAVINDQPINFDKPGSPGAESSLVNSFKPSSTRSSRFYRNEEFSNSNAQDKAEDRASKILKMHIVTNDELASQLSKSPTKSERRNSVLDDYSVSHQLQGGSMTRDIYKWQEGYKNNALKRRSVSVSQLNESINGEEQEYQSMMAPGGFRRQFVKQKAITSGKEPLLVTKSFIDFLALYGHFAGDYYPSDEDDSETEEAFSANESTPLRESSKKITSLATASSKKVFFLLLKSFVGTGVLFLPRAFYNGGLLFSSIMLAIVAYLGLYCMLLLIEAYHILGGSYGDLGKKLFGEKARRAVLTCIVMSQYGFCCAYTIFIAKNLQQVFNFATDNRYNVSSYWFIFMQLAVYIPMSLVRKIKYFSTAALVADVFIVSGIVYLYYFGIGKLLTDGIADVLLFNSQSYALMIGTAVFTFEGIGLVIPIAESIKEPKRFPTILSLTMFLCAFVFISIAALCYAIFGSEVNSVVLLNLPSDSNIVGLVQFFYALAIIFSLPLQLFPVVRIIEAMLFPKKSGKGDPAIKWKKNLFRTLLAITVACASYFGESSLDRIVGLIGAFACIPLCFIFPSLFHLKAIKNVTPQQIQNSQIPLSLGKFQIAKDTSLLIMGIAVMIYVTYIILTNWGSA